MRGQRLPRKRRFQVGGATPGTFGAAPNPLMGALANQQAQMGAAGGMPPAGAPAPAPAPAMPPAMGIPGAPTNAAIQNAITNPQSQLAFQNFRNQFGGGMPGGMPQGAAGLGAGMGAGPGQAGAGPAGNLAALRAAMMQRRGAMAAPGAQGAPMSQWGGIAGTAPGIGMAGQGMPGQVTGQTPGAMMGMAGGLTGAGLGFKRGGKVGKKAAGGELEGDTPPGARVSNWRARQWGERDRSASDLPPKAERKARGGVVAKRPKGPPKVSIAVGISKRKPIPTPSPFDYDQQEESGSAAPGMASGGKWIQGAIQHPGALRKRMGVKEGEKIPAKKLNAAAEKGGTLGRQARLAKTLGKMRKAKGGACEEKAKGGLADRGPGGLFDSDQSPLGARGAPEKRRPRTGHYGEKERAETKARGGLLGGMPLNRRGTRTGHPEERRPRSGGYGEEGAEKRAKGGLHDEARGGLHTGTGGDRTPKFKSTSNLVKAKKLSKGPGGPSLSFAAGGAAKERRGFPNTIAPPKRLAKGGKVRGTGIAQRGTHFSGIF